MNDERPYTLGEILEAHRVEQLGFPGHVKCHACDDWTTGTIHDHHADLALAHFDFTALTARLARVEALADQWKAERDAPFGDAHMSYAYAQHTLRAALAEPPETPK